MTLAFIHASPCDICAEAPAAIVLEGLCLCEPCWEVLSIPAPAPQRLFSEPAPGRTLDEVIFALTGRHI